MVQPIHPLDAYYRQYGPLVYRRCAALTSNAGDAEDATQETFLRAQKYPRPDDGTSPLAWLYTIAHRCCFDLLRKRGRFTLAAPEAMAELDPRRSGDARDADDRALVIVALGQLDEATREIGLLHHLGGLTQEELVAHAGLSRKTVAKRLKSFADALARAAASRMERPA